MLARPIRTAAMVVAALAALAATACVRGRNDGGADPAGGSSNGAGPAPQPGPLGGQSTDTSMIAPAAPAATMPTPPPAR